MIRALVVPRRKPHATGVAATCCFGAILFAPEPLNKDGREGVGGFLPDGRPSNCGLAACDCKHFRKLKPAGGTILKLCELLLPETFYNCTAVSVR